MDQSVSCGRQYNINRSHDGHVCSMNNKVVSDSGELKCSELRCWFKLHNTVAVFALPFVSRNQAQAVAAQLCIVVKLLLFVVCQHSAVEIGVYTDHRSLCAANRLCNSSHNTD